MKKVMVALALVLTVSLSSTVVAGASAKSGGSITVDGPRFTR